MHKLILLTLMSLFGSLAHASDDWFCTTQDSERSGSVVKSCGVAESTLEEEARRRALEAAIREFKIVCNESDDCYGHKLSIEPKRSSCSSDHAGLIKCIRMIQVTIGS